MTGEGVHKLVRAEVPDLNGLVPGSRDNVGGHGALVRSGNTHTGNPLGMASLLTSAESGCAAANDVPDLDSLVSGTRDDVLVGVRESNREHILGVATEEDVLGVVLEVPEAEGTVPRTGENVLTVSSAGNVLDVVVVTDETALREAELLILALGDSPDDDRLVAGR